MTTGNQVKLILAGSRVCLVEVDGQVYLNQDDEPAKLSPVKLAQVSFGCGTESSASESIMREAVDIPDFDKLSYDLENIDKILTHYRNGVIDNSVRHHTGSGKFLTKPPGLPVQPGRHPRVSMTGGNRLNMAIPGWKIVATHTGVTKDAEKSGESREEMLKRLLGSHRHFSLEDIEKRIKQEKENNPKFEWGPKDWEELNNIYVSATNDELSDMFNLINWQKVTDAFQRETDETQQFGYRFIMRTRDMVDDVTSDKYIVFGYRPAHGVVGPPVVFNFSTWHDKKSRVRAAKPSDFPLGFLGWAFLYSNSHDQDPKTQSGLHSALLKKLLKIKKSATKPGDNANFMAWLKDKKKDEVSSGRTSSSIVSQAEEDDINSPVLTKDRQTDDHEFKVISPRSMKSSVLLEKFNKLGEVRAGETQSLWYKILPHVKGARYFTNGIRIIFNLDGERLVSPMRRAGGTVHGGSTDVPTEDLVRSYIILGYEKDKNVPWVVSPGRRLGSVPDRDRKDDIAPAHIRKAVPSDFYNKLLWYALYFLHDDENPEEDPPFEGTVFPRDVLITEVRAVDATLASLEEKEARTGTGAVSGHGTWKEREKSGQRKKYTKRGAAASSGDDDDDEDYDDPNARDENPSEGDDSEPGDYEAPGSDD